MGKSQLPLINKALPNFAKTTENPERDKNTLNRSHFSNGYTRRDCLFFFHITINILTYESNACTTFLVVSAGTPSLSYTISPASYILYRFGDLLKDMALFGGFFWYCISREGPHCILATDINKYN